MKTATLYKCGNSYTWAANYPDGGIELNDTVKLLKESANAPTYHFFCGGRTLHERAVAALDSYSGFMAKQGYTTREQAEYGKRVKPKPPLREYKKSIGQRLYEWFTEAVEE